MGADHPVTWCKDYQGGRSYYTNHGASAAAWNDAELAKELPARSSGRPAKSDPVYSDCGATVLANYQQSSWPHRRTSASRSASTCCPRTGA